MITLKWYKNCSPWPAGHHNLGLRIENFSLIKLLPTMREIELSKTIPKFGSLIIIEASSSTSDRISNSKNSCAELDSTFMIYDRCSSNMPRIPASQVYLPPNT